MAQPDAPCGGPHDPEKAFGVHQFADEGSLAKGNDLWGFRLGPLKFDRLGLVDFDHGDAVSINEAAFEPDVLTILSTKQVRSSEFSQPDEQKLIPDLAPVLLICKTVRGDSKRVPSKVRSTPNSNAPRSMGFATLRPAKEHRNRSKRAAQTILKYLPRPAGLLDCQPM